MRFSISRALRYDNIIITGGVANVFGVDERQTVLVRPYTVIRFAITSRKQRFVRTSVTIQLDATGVPSDFRRRTSRQVGKCLNRRDIRTRAVLYIQVRVKRHKYFLETFVNTGAASTFTSTNRWYITYMIVRATSVSKKKNKKKRLSIRSPAVCCCVEFRTRRALPIKCKSSINNTYISRASHKHYSNFSRGDQILRRAFFLHSFFLARPPPRRRVKRDTNSFQPPPPPPPRCLHSVYTGITYSF